MARKVLILILLLLVGCARPEVILGIGPEDDGSSFNVLRGARIQLTLPDGFRWSIQLSDPAAVEIVSAPPGDSVDSALWVLRGVRSGRVELRATGEPSCRFDAPPCAAPTRPFRVGLQIE